MNNCHNEKDFFYVNVSKKLGARGSEFTTEVPPIVNLNRNAKCGVKSVFIYSQYPVYTAAKSDYEFSIIEKLEDLPSKRKNYLKNLFNCAKFNGTAADHDGDDCKHGPYVAQAVDEMNLQVTFKMDLDGNYNSHRNILNEFNRCLATSRFHKSDKFVISTGSANMMTIMYHSHAYTWGTSRQKIFLSDTFSDALQTPKVFKTGYIPAKSVGSFKESDQVAIALLPVSCLLTLDILEPQISGLTPEPILCDLLIGTNSERRIEVRYVAPAVDFFDLRKGSFHEMTFKLIGQDGKRLSFVDSFEISIKIVFLNERTDDDYTLSCF